MTINYVDETIDAAITKLEADAALQVNGTLGINRIEREFPQPGDAPRDFPKASLPALSVSAKSGTSSWVLTHTRSLPVDLRVRVVHEGGATRTVAEEIAKILENVRDVLQENIRTYTGTFLSSSVPVIERGIAEISDVEQVEGWPLRFVGSVTIPVDVIHPAPGL